MTMIVELTVVPSAANSGCGARSMTKSEEAPGGRTPTEQDAESRPGELEQVRELLFGERSRRSDKQLDALERRLAALEGSVRELRDELTAALGELDGRSVGKARLSALLADLTRRLEEE